MTPGGPIRSRCFLMFLWILLFGFGIILLEPAFADTGKLYQAQNKRDPFVPLASLTMKAATSGLVGVESIEDIQIEGVVMDADPRKSIVVVNGSVLRSGDEVGSVKVLEIGPEGARFSVNGSEGYKPLYQDKAGNRA